MLFLNCISQNRRMLGLNIVPELSSICLMIFERVGVFPMQMLMLHWRSLHFNNSEIELHRDLCANQKHNDAE